jgi:t-SNARE complex subunit (syntaxin)
MPCFTPGSLFPKFRAAGGFSTFWMSFASGASGAPASIQDDVTNFERRFAIIRDNRTKLQNPQARTATKRALGECENLANSLKVKVQTSADPAVRERFTKCYQEFQQVNRPLTAQIASLEEKERAAAQEQARPSNPTLTTSLLSDQEQGERFQADHVQYLEGQAVEIAGQMREVNALAHDLDTKIVEQHQLVVRIDDTIGDGLEQMHVGNENLSQAEEHQKSSTKCLIWILALALGGVVVLGLIIGLSLGL